MLSEKSIHYFIVAALATSFSSDAFAATTVADTAEPQETSGNFEEVAVGSSTSMRATSRGFSDPISLDVNLWNSSPLIAESYKRHVIDASATSTSCQGVCQQVGRSCSAPTKHVATAEPEKTTKNVRIDLGDGRALELDAIRYQDASFSTTMSASHLKPIAVSLNEVTPNLDEDGRQIVDWYRSELTGETQAKDLELASGSATSAQWRFLGRVVEPHSNDVVRHVEGQLPLRVQLHRDASDDVQLAIEVDAPRLAEQLRG